MSDFLQLHPGTHGIRVGTSTVGYFHIPTSATENEGFHWASNAWADSFTLTFDTATYSATNSHVWYPQGSLGSSGSYSPGENQHGTVWKLRIGTNVVGWMFRHNGQSITPGKLEWFGKAAHVSNGRIDFTSTSGDLKFDKIDPPGSQTVLYFAHSPVT